VPDEVSGKEDEWQRAAELATAAAADLIQARVADPPIDEGVEAAAVEDAAEAPDEGDSSDTSSSSDSSSDSSSSSEPGEEVVEEPHEHGREHRQGVDCANVYSAASSSGPAEIARARGIASPRSNVRYPPPCVP
jgi:hypothetical protein